MWDFRSISLESRRSDVEGVTESHTLMVRVETWGREGKTLKQVGVEARAEAGPTPAQSGFSPDSVS